MNSDNMTDSYGASDPGPDAAARRPRDDYWARYSHEMSQETSDASGRFLLRSVPILYGFLVGAILGHIPAGIAVGVGVSIALVLTLRD